MIKELIEYLKENSNLKYPLLTMIFAVFAMLIVTLYINVKIVDYAGITRNELSSILFYSFFFGSGFGLIFANIKFTKYITHDFMVFLALFAISVAIYIFSKYDIISSYIELLIGFTLFRITKSSYFTLSRTICLDMVTSEDNKPVFTIIKFTNSSIRALGIIAGYYLTTIFSFGMNLYVSITFFIIALLFATKIPKRTNKPTEVNHKNRIYIFVLFASFVAMIHFIFDSQLLSFISFMVKETYPTDYYRILRNIFLINAIALIIFTIPVLKYINNLKNKFFALYIGLFCSLATVLLVYHFVSSRYVIYFSILLFTTAEIITPQILSNYISYNKEKNQLRLNFAIYNFLSVGVGVASGMFLGIRILDHKEFITPFFISLHIIAVILFLIMLKIDQSKFIKIGRGA